MSNLFELVYRGTDYSYENLRDSVDSIEPKIFAEMLITKAKSEKNFSDAFVGINKALSLSDSEYISFVVEELDDELLVFKFGYEPIQYLKMLLIGDSLLPYRNTKSKKSKKNKTKKKKNSKAR